MRPERKAFFENASKEGFFNLETLPTADLYNVDSKELLGDDLLKVLEIHEEDVKLLESMGIEAGVFGRFSSFEGKLFYERNCCLLMLVDGDHLAMVGKNKKKYFLDLSYDSSGKYRHQKEFNKSLFEREMKELKEPNQFSTMNKKAVLNWLEHLKKEIEVLRKCLNEGQNFNNEYSNIIKMFELESKGFKHWEDTGRSSANFKKGQFHTSSENRKPFEVDYDIEEQNKHFDFKVSFSNVEKAVLFFNVLNGYKF